VRFEGGKTMNVRHLKLCLITNLQGQSFTAYKNFLLQGIAGGVTSVQLREKIPSVDLYELAGQFQSVLKPLGIPLIINDDVEIAQAVDAAGVHLGQTDMSPVEARKKLNGKIIGWSIETLEQLHIANRLDCIDYVAASAVFPSRTKPDCRTIWRLEGLQKIVTTSRLPVMAIGGIGIQNVKAVMGTGACGIAVVGALHRQEPRQAAAELIHAIEEVSSQLTPSLRIDSHPKRPTI
jgi:thiamine-phosphate pyrophosphorylase